MAVQTALYIGPAAGTLSQVRVPFSPTDVSRVTMSAGIALDDKERLKTRHNTIFGEMKSPLPSMMGGRARGLIAAACIVVLAATVSYFR